VWRRATIALLPSTYGEGVPKALLEAAACARPIIATNVPGCRETIRTGEHESGLLVPPRDVDALAMAITALATDPTRCAVMGRSGRALIETHFAEEIVARETLALYESALVERVAPR
jgi:glycosyltransferase involved in cell wall biosynthesis